MTKLGRAQTEQKLAENAAQRKEMDYLREMRQAMDSSRDRPSVVMGYRHAAARKKREQERYTTSVTEAGFVLPPLPTGFQQDLDKVLSNLSERDGTTWDKRRRKFLGRPLGPQKGDPDYDVSLRTSNNLYAQVLASPPRREIVSHTLLPRALLDTYTVVKEESLDVMRSDTSSNAPPPQNYISAVFNGKPIIPEELHECDNLRVTSNWYQRSDALNMHSLFDYGDKRLALTSVRVLKEQGMRVFTKEALIDIGMASRLQVVEMVEDILKSGHENSAANKDDTSANLSVSFVFDSPPKTVVDYSDGIPTAVHFSPCGMTPEEFGLTGNTSVPLSDAIYPLIYALFKYSSRVRGPGYFQGHLDEQAQERISQRRKDIVAFNNGESTENVINKNMRNSGQKVHELVKGIAESEGERPNKSNKGGKSGKSDKKKSVKKTGHKKASSKA